MDIEKQINDYVFCNKCETNPCKCSWQERLKILIPEKTDNVIIHGYRQLTRGKIKQFISDLITQTREEAQENIDEKIRQEYQDNMADDDEDYTTYGEHLEDIK